MINISLSETPFGLCLFPANSVGTIPDSRNNSELPETLLEVSDKFSSDLYHLLDHTLDVLTCHHTLKCVTLRFGIHRTWWRRSHLNQSITVGSWATAVTPGHPRRQPLFVRLTL